MELRSNYLLAGGIAHVVMHPSNSTLPDEPLTVGDSSLTMPLHHEGSSYSELRNCSAGLYTVTHRLTVVGYLGEDMASEEELQALLLSGIVADVKLNSGATIRVGWSSKFGVAAPLRLVSSEVVSGEKRLDYPLRKWVWESTDASALI